ncbi:MAG: RDD family protein [Thermodesulfobacteriota bacterium]
MWHYADGDRAVGPVSDEEFQALVKKGAITGQTLVWREGMGEWQPYGRLQAGESGGAYCTECGRYFSTGDMIRYGPAYVCAACKNTFFQKIKEGVALPGVMLYAGFWIRFGAKMIDGIVLWIVQMVFMLPLNFILATGEADESPVMAVVASALYVVVSLAIYILYPTLLVGKYGATLGKMACQIKIVTSGGGKVSYLRALGRAFAEWLTGLTLTIGYIIAAFDEQKRALHDHICDTRVVYK